MDFNYQIITWKNYDVGLDVMEGYLISISQALDKMDHDPTHIFLQAGVGGLALYAAYCRKKLGYSPIIIIVEPSYAPCLQRSIEMGGLLGLRVQHLIWEG